MSADPFGEQPVLLSTALATRADWRLALPVVLLSLAAFFITIPLVKLQFAYVVGVHPDLSDRARDHRPDDRGPSARAVQHHALAGDAGAGLRLSLHRLHGRPTYPFVPRPVLRDGTARRQSEDHGLAVHVLARRISARRDGLCVAQRPRRPSLRWHTATPGVELARDPLRDRHRPCGDRGPAVARDRRLRGAAAAGAERRLHRRDDLCEQGSVGAHVRGAGRAGVAASVFGARRMADGGAVRLAVRRGLERGVQRPPLRSRVLCRTRLRLHGRGLRPDDDAGRDRKDVRARGASAHGGAAGAAA